MGGLLRREDVLPALLVSLFLHALVIGLVSFSWSASPELERAPKAPSFVQAVVLEKPQQRPPARASKPKPVAKPKPKPQPKPQPKPRPKPKPESVAKPEAKPVPKPAPVPTEPAFSEPDLSELLAREEIDMAQPADSPSTEVAQEGEDGEDAEQVASYHEAIKAAISSRWIIPATAREKDDLVVRVRIHLLPGGEVLDAVIVKSSGDQSLDNSVIAAVTGVGSLPVPDGELFHRQFRVFSIDFRPPRTSSR